MCRFSISWVQVYTLQPNWVAMAIRYTVAVSAKEDKLQIQQEAIEDSVSSLLGSLLFELEKEILKVIIVNTLY